MTTYRIMVRPNGQDWAWVVKEDGQRIVASGTSRRITNVEEEAREALFWYLHELGADSPSAACRSAETVMEDIYKPDMNLPKTVVCDIDGTLALHSGRGPYDFDKLGSDSLNLPVAWSLEAYAEMGHTIVLLSGRQEEYRPHTERWLERYLIPYAELHMRPVGDRRSDDLVKYDLFGKVRDRHFVWLVMDDRDRCVYLWRKMGLTCFQVAPGDF